MKAPLLPRHRFTRCSPSIVLFAIVALLCFGRFTTFASDEADEGFTALGKDGDTSVFTFVGTPESTWTFDGNVIRCAGKPNGYLATVRSYRNFVLRLDVRYVRPADLADDSAFKGNSGILLYITGEKKVWPQCVEVQGRNFDMGRIIAIGGAKPVKATEDVEARKQALHPVGEWNSLEIVSKDGAVTSTLNGARIATSEAGELREGPIGFQSEGVEIHFRNLRIKELP